MLPIIPRRYYQYIERDTYKISLKWKVLHALIFFLIAINSFLSAYSFHGIFHIFNFRCILYAKPALVLKNIEYVPTIEYATTEYVPTEYDTNTDIDSTTIYLNNTWNASRPLDTEKVHTTTENVPGVEIRNGTYFFSNDTLTGEVYMELAKTVFTSDVFCDLALSFPLISMIFAVFFCALVIICGRGGRGYSTDLMPQSWMYVYPMLVITGAMLISSVISSGTALNGLRRFCEDFSQYTGQKACSKLMNYFSHHRGYFKHFYEMYVMCYCTFSLGVILWVSQLILILLRIFCVVDFQLKSIRIRSKNHDPSADKDKIVQEALMKAYPGMTKAKTTATEDEKLNQNEETTKI